MIPSAKLAITVICISIIPLMAQGGNNHICPHLLANSSLIVNIDGKFVNEEKNKNKASIEWRHHSDALDTFFVKLSDSPSFSYITAGKYRYMEFEDGKVKRQLGLHHLRENIGKTPLKLDDLELLANGYFKCPDSTKKELPPNVLSTAVSNTWWSVVVDTLPNPEKIVMRGASKKARYISVTNWKSFAGELLPTLASLSSDDYSGSLWISSAYPKHVLETNPLQRPKKPKILLPVPKLFGKIAVEGERKIPLILKLNKQLLSE